MTLLEYIKSNPGKTFNIRVNKKTYLGRPDEYIRLFGPDREVKRITHKMILPTVTIS